MQPQVRRKCKVRNIIRLRKIRFEGSKLAEQKLGIKPESSSNHGQLKGGSYHPNNF